MEAAAKTAPAQEQCALRDGQAAAVSVAKPEPAYQPFVTVVIAVAAGICADRFGGSSFAAARISQATGISWFAIWWWASAASLVAWRLARRQQRAYLAGMALVLAAVTAGAAWHHAKWNLFGRFEVARYVERAPAPACVEAILVGAPERVRAPRPTPLRAIPGSERTRLTVNLLAIRDGKKWRPASGKCQLLVEGHKLGVRPGDRLRIFGQVARIAAPLNPGEFDFAAHARADRQLMRMRSSAPDSVTVLQSGPAWLPGGDSWRRAKRRETARGALCRSEPCRSRECHSAWRPRRPHGRGNRAVSADGHDSCAGGIGA